MDGVSLTFDRDARDYIVDKAIEYKLGARGLRSLTETIMMDVMYEVPADKSIKEFHVTRALAEEKLSRINPLTLQASQG